MVDKFPVSHREFHSPDLIACQASFAYGVVYPVRVVFWKRGVAGHSGQSGKFLDVDQLVSLFRFYDFMDTAVFPFFRVSHDSCPDHIGVYVERAPHKMFACLHSRGMVASFPKASFASGFFIVGGSYF